jgi:hypothetical protein
VENRSGKPLQHKPELASLAALKKAWFIVVRFGMRKEREHMTRTKTALICGLTSAAFCAAGLIRRTKKVRHVRAFEAKCEEEAVSTLEGEGGLVLT